MTQKEFAEKILKVTPVYWGMVLRCERHLGYEKAQVAASVLNTSFDLWINPKANKNERRGAWNLFSLGRNK